MPDEFTESVFTDKLTHLNDSSHSIQTLSEWVINHRNHYTRIVKIWVREIIKAPDRRRITLMFLANDVIQNSRKICSEYGYEFGRDLEKVFKHINSSDEKTRDEIERLLTIWLEREVYSPLKIALFQRALVMGFKDPYAILKARTATTTQSNRQERANVKIDNILETQVRPHIPQESYKIIKAVQEFGSNIMSPSVQNVTEEIANLTEIIPDDSTIARIQDKEEAENLAFQVRDVVGALNRNKTSLASKVQQRKTLVNMMKEFVQEQEELISQEENSCQEYQEKLSDISTVGQRLEEHMQSLPDTALMVSHNDDDDDDGVGFFMQ